MYSALAIAHTLGLDQAAFYSLQCFDQQPSGFLE